ncbi:MAG: FtsW/RodA/SpoVE family cell cycle protein [bacterium]|nr:FtsW/RodA/SpoVE family cell cycle protein [bacterium]
MMFLLKRYDWFLNTALTILIVVSLVIVYSVATNLFWQQLIWLALAIILFVICSLFNWGALVNYRWFLWSVYGLSIILLIATFLFAPAIRSTHSWLVLGPIQFQTSELAKLALIIILASFFARSHIKIAHFKTVLKSFLYFLLPAVLIFVQPDLGTTIILFGIWLGFLLVSGLSKKHILVGLLILVLASLIGWNFLQDYQQQRIIGLFDAGYDPLGINYGVIQSKIAIGSAGFWGKGFNQGTQSQLGFLPESATDFILAAFIEEWGLLGGFLVIGAFLFLVLRILKIGLQADNNFSRFICLGVVVMFLLQFILNVGSTLGLLPVVGVTFPFFSYGGSSLLINAGLIGIVQSIAMRSRS